MISMKRKGNRTMTETERRVSMHTTVRGSNGCSLSITAGAVENCEPSGRSYIYSNHIVMHGADGILMDCPIDEFMSHALLGFKMNQEFEGKKVAVKQAGSFLSVIESQCQYCTDWNPTEGCESTKKVVDPHPVADCIHQERKN